MSEQWLIDGYNLLHALRDEPSRKSLSRDELFSLVAGFASFKKADVLLVLDGVGPEAELDMHATAHFRAIFSGKVPADAVIEKYLFDHRQTKRMTVVTNDHAITNIGRGGGAQVLGTGIFSEMLKETAKESAEMMRHRKSKDYGFHRPFGDKLKDL